MSTGKCSASPTREETLLDERTTRDILAGLARADEAAIERGKGKDLVLILGHTGSGKSTFVNYAMGKVMREEKKPNQLSKGFVCDNPIMEIGHGFQSQTAFPESCCDTSTNITYCDCPGFMDNRGVVFDITNMYAISRMAEMARSVKGCVIIINYHGLENKRVEELRDVATLIDIIFGSKAAPHKNSVMILVTRLPTDTTLHELRDFMVDAVKSGYMTGTHDSYELFQHLAHTCECYDPLDRYCSQPLNRLSRLQLSERLQQFSGIPHTSLNVGLSNEAVNTLSSMLATLQDAAKDNFRKQDIDNVILFLSLVDGLRVLRCAVVEKSHGDFIQYMIIQLHAWSKDLEMMTTIQDIGMKLHVLREHTDIIVETMVKEIEEKKRQGELIDVMEKDISLAKQEIKTSKLENAALHAANEAAKAKNDADQAELRKQEESIKKLEREIEKSKADAIQLREELSRPKQSDGLDSQKLAEILTAAFSQGGGLGSGCRGMPMGGVPMDMYESFGGMNITPPPPQSRSQGGSSGGPKLYTGKRGGVYEKKISKSGNTYKKYHSRK